MIFQFLIINVIFIIDVKTREELKNALEDEIRAFGTDKDLAVNCLIAWNHQEFEVQYNSLSEEIRIGQTLIP